MPNLFLVTYGFGVIAKETFPTPRSQRCTTISFFCEFYSFSCYIRYLIQVELIFAYGVR